MAEKSEDNKLTEKLYVKNLPLLKETASDLLKDEWASEDIVHDCVLELMQNIDKVKNLTEAEQLEYLCTSVIRLSEKHLSEINEKYVFVENVEEFFDRIFIPRESPEEITEAKLCGEQAAKEMHKLNISDRKAIELKYLFHLHDRDIAPLLGVKENCVRMTVRRSVLRLKKQLGLIKSHEPIQ